MNKLMISAIVLTGAVSHGSYAVAHEDGYRSSVRVVTDTRYVGTHVKSGYRHHRIRQSAVSPITLGIAIGYPLILHDHRSHRGTHFSHFDRRYGQSHRYPGQDRYRDHHKHGSGQRSTKYDRQDCYDRHDRKRGHRGWR